MSPIDTGGTGFVHFESARVVLARWLMSPARCPDTQAISGRPPLRGLAPARNSVNMVILAPIGTSTNTRVYFLRPSHAIFADAPALSASSPFVPFLPPSLLRPVLAAALALAARVSLHAAALPSPSSPLCSAPGPLQCQCVIWRLFAALTPGCCQPHRRSEFAHDGPAAGQPQGVKSFSGAGQRLGEGAGARIGAAAVYPLGAGHRLGGSKRDARDLTQSAGSTGAGHTGAGRTGVNRGVPGHTGAMGAAGTAGGRAAVIDLTSDVVEEGITCEICQQIIAGSLFVDHSIGHQQEATPRQCMLPSC